MSQKEETVQVSSASSSASSMSSGGSALLNRRCCGFKVRCHLWPCDSRHPWKMFLAVPSDFQSALPIAVTPRVARHPPPWEGRDVALSWESGCSDFFKRFVFPIFNTEIKQRNSLPIFTAGLHNLSLRTSGRVFMKSPVIVCLQRSRVLPGSQSSLGENLQGVSQAGLFCQHLISTKNAHYSTRSFVYYYYLAISIDS